MTLSLAASVANVALMYALTQRLFRRQLLAALAAGVLALTPAHLVYSRVPVDHLFPIGVVLAWLICMTVFVERGTPALVFVGGLLLGAGVYLSSSSVVMMPVYFLLTWLTVYVCGGSLQSYGVALAGFLLPLPPFVVHHVRHPELHVQQIARHAMYDATRLDPLQGVRELLNYASLTERSAVYWDYFNPAFLFLTGGTGIGAAPVPVGLLLFPLAIFLPLGLCRIVVRERAPLPWLLVLGLLLSPFAAALAAERYAVHLAVGMLPFAVVIATFGVDTMLAARKMGTRAAAVCLLALALIQFGCFYARMPKEVGDRTVLSDQSRV